MTAGLPTGLAVRPGAMVDGTRIIFWGAPSSCVEQAFMALLMGPVGGVEQQLGELEVGQREFRAITNPGGDFDGLWKRFTS